MPESRTKIHGTAEVEEGSSIGAGTSVWRFSCVRKGAIIGEGCNIGQSVYIDEDVQIGSFVKIQNNVSVYYGVTLEDYVFCGPSMVFTNVHSPRSMFPKTRDSFDKTLVRRGATLGANATIVCGITVGEHAFIGAGSVVTKDVPDFALMVGVPAKRIGWSCVCGKQLELSGGHADCSCGRGYQETGGVLTLLKGDK